MFKIFNQINRNTARIDVLDLQVIELRRLNENLKELLESETKTLRTSLNVSLPQNISDRIANLEAFYIKLNDLFFDKKEVDKPSRFGRRWVKKRN